jgi:heat shock protein HslJ
MNQQQQLVEVLDRNMSIHQPAPYVLQQSYLFQLRGWASQYEESLAQMVIEYTKVSFSISYGGAQKHGNNTIMGIATKDGTFHRKFDLTFDICDEDLFDANKSFMTLPEVDARLKAHMKQLGIDVNNFTLYFVTTIPANVAKPGNGAKVRAIVERPPADFQFKIG